MGPHVEQRIDDRAVIIGVEHYDTQAPAIAARDDAELMAQVLHARAGVPRQNIHLLLDQAATAGEIRRAIRRAAQETPEGATLWIYFAGHGLGVAGGDASARGARLLGSAVRTTSVEAVIEGSVGRDEVVEMASSSRATRALIIFDACFTGKDRSGAPLTQLRGIGYQPVGQLDARIAVWSATNEHQFASLDPDAQHGAFTYAMAQVLDGWSARERALKLGIAMERVRQLMRTRQSGGPRQEPTLNTGDPRQQEWVIAQVPPNDVDKHRAEAHVEQVMRHFERIVPALWGGGRAALVELDEFSAIYDRHPLGNPLQTTAERWRRHLESELARQRGVTPPESTMSASAGEAASEMCRQPFDWAGLDAAWTLSESLQGPGLAAHAVARLTTPVAGRPGCVATLVGPDLAATLDECLPGPTCDGVSLTWGLGARADGPRDTRRCLGIEARTPAGGVVLLRVEGRPGDRYGAVALLPPDGIRPTMPSAMVHFPFGGRAARSRGVVEARFGHFEHSHQSPDGALGAPLLDEHGRLIGLNGDVGCRSSGHRRVVRLDAAALGLEPDAASDGPVEGAFTLGNGVLHEGVYIGFSLGRATDDRLYRGSVRAMEGEAGYVWRRGAWGLSLGGSHGTGEHTAEVPTYIIGGTTRLVRWYSTTTTLDAGGMWSTYPGITLILTARLGAAQIESDVKDVKDVSDMIPLYVTNAHLGAEMTVCAISICATYGYTAPQDSPGDRFNDDSVGQHAFSLGVRFGFIEALLR